MPAVSVEQVIPLAVGDTSVALIVWRARAAHGEGFRFCLPLARVADASQVVASSVVGRVPGSAEVLIDATALDPFVRELVTAICFATPGAEPAPVVASASDANQAPGPVPAAAVALQYRRTNALDSSRLKPADAAGWTIRRSRAEQSNTSIRVGDGAIFKLLRKVERGMHPELEMARYLTDRAHFPATPALLGWIDSGDTTLAILQAYVPNDGDGWTWLTERLRADPAAAGLGWLERLGERTGELHVALAADTADPAFAPETISTADWQGWKAAVLSMGERLARDLQDCAAALDADARTAADEYCARVATLDAALSGLLPAADLRKPGGGALKKTRHHGDYHLGQVLVAQDDAVIVDFEGEPLRPLAERRAKHCALRDVAGMLRSFHYAAAIAGVSDDGWVDAATERYLRGYFRRAQSSCGCPPGRDAALRLVRFFSLEKALYEVRYELANRPAWVAIPLDAVNRLLALAAGGSRAPSA